MGYVCTGYMRVIKQNCVKKWRVFKGLQQTEVAEAIGMVISTYRNMEQNKRRLRLTEQRKLAKYFGISEKQLYEE